MLMPRSAPTLLTLVLVAWNVHPVAALVSDVASSVTFMLVP